MLFPQPPDRDWGMCSKHYHTPGVEPACNGHEHSHTGPGRALRIAALSLQCRRSMFFCRSSNTAHARCTVQVSLCCISCCPYMNGKFADFAPAPWQNRGVNSASCKCKSCVAAQKLSFPFVSMQGMLDRSEGQVSASILPQSSDDSWGGTGVT